jgi:4-hydroxy-tetrahydrodipicolinate synthase
MCEGNDLINDVIDGGVDYLVTMGTTGESATLDWDEKVSVMEFTADKANGRVPVVAGFGGNNTQAIIDSIRRFHFNGIDGILSVSPYYNKPSQQGIYEHYKTISEATDLPVILYNVPGRTSSNILAETTLRLAQDCKNIIGIKEASGDLEQCMQIVKGKPKDFLVISGEDPLTLPMMSFGVDGVISVVANALPGLFSEMVRQANTGNFTKAGEYHLKAMDLIPLLFVEGNPAGVKAALAAKGTIKNVLRLPLVPVSNDTNEKIRAVMDGMA